MRAYDYNGNGRWSTDAVMERYQGYCRELATFISADIVPRRDSQDDVTRIYPIMDEIIAGAEGGDKACIAIALEFIEEDQHFPFGKRLKANAARALRRAALSEEQIERVRQRVVNMLLAGIIPYEFKEYAKLLRRVGLGSWWPLLEQGVPRDNRYAMRFFIYLRDHLRDVPS